MKQCIYLFCGFVFINVIIIVPARAQPPPASIGISISPPSYELTANPGEKLDEVIKVTNQSDDTIAYTTNVEDFRVEGTEGIVSLQDESRPNDFSSWFHIDPAEFTVGPHQSQMIKFAVVVPQNGEPGGHFASILFQPKAVGSATGTGAHIVQRVGALVLLNVSGSSIEKGKLETVLPKTFVGGWDEVLGSDGKTKILMAKAEKLDQEKVQHYFSQGPIAFDMLIKNEGNVHFKPIGFVTIRNFLGHKVAQVAIDPRNVFPGGERRITAIWPNKHPYGIYYRAEVTALYGTKNQTMTAETIFWAFPLPVAAGIGTVLLLMVIARRRLAKVVRILLKGE